LPPPTDRCIHLGKSYERLKGSLSQIVTLTADDREQLFSLARSFDEAVPASEPRAAKRSPGGRLRPGDALNGGATWSEVLRPHGWTEQYTNGEVTYWARPGKDIGVSATTNFGGSDLMYVFTTSTAFDANRSYDKFGAYAVLEHDGDFEAAAAALRQKGYGAADFHLTDLGNAERFVADHHGLVRYSPGIGWFIWNGSRWAPDDLGQVYVLAKETVRRILRDLN